MNSYLYRVEPDGSVTSLTGHSDRSSISLFSGGQSKIRWIGDTAVVGYEDAGTFGIAEVAPDGVITQVVRDRGVVTGFDVHEDQLVHTGSFGYQPPQLYLNNQQSAQLSDGIPVIEGDHFTVGSDDNELDVWVYLPEGDDPVPLLLNIHGGPASQYGFGFFDEFQVYAGAGYGVVATNPRGSSGKGEKFLNSVRGDGWGTVDLVDIHAALDAAASRHQRLDTDRMGVMGGSYGGFMTAWIIGQEPGWKSAVVERALTSFTSFTGTSDIGGAFPANYLEEEYPDSWEMLWEKSPLRLVSQVKTPTMIIHSEEDWRCPIEQAEQYFMGLVRNGTEAEFLQFPQEGHEMSRSGKPKHRLERFEAILEWHQRHLK